MDNPATGVVARSAAILEAIANHSPSPASITQLSRDTGLTRPTVHRIVGDLARVGAVEKHGPGYLLGPALSDLSTFSRTHSVDITALEPIVQDLATTSSYTVYLTQLNHGHSHYLLRCDGNSPIRTFNVDVGEYRRLPVCYAGIALLGTQSTERRQAEIGDLVCNPPGFFSSDDPDWLRHHTEELLNQLDQRGWCGGQDAVPLVAGIACPVPRDDISQPQLAVTISGVSSLLTAERREDLAPAMIETARKISDVLENSTN